MLLLPVVRFEPAEIPKAMLLLPVVLLKSALHPVGRVVCRRLCWQAARSTPVAVF